MPDPSQALVFDLLEWIGSDPRPYAEVIEVWRTSCPRMPVWEDANSKGLITREHREGVGAFVSVSPAGLALLAQHRRNVLAILGTGTGTGIGSAYRTEAD